MPRAWLLNRPAEPSRGWKVAAALTLAFALLALTTRLFCLDADGNSSFWPANGAILVAMLVLEPRLKILVAASCLTLNLFLNVIAHYPLFDNVLFSVLNVAMSILAASLTRRLCGASTDLSRVNRLVTFAVIAMGTAGLEAMVGDLVKSLLNEEASVADWVQWTLCDGLGLLVCTPALLLVIKHRRYNFKGYAGMMERSTLFAATGIIAACSFLFPRSPGFLFVYPLLVMIAFRAGPAWVLGSIMMVSLVASGMTAHGFGPLAFLSPSGPLLISDMMQPYLLSLFVCALPPNSVLGERNRTGKRLERLHAAARRAQRSADEANAAKSIFIANISHEIRTPLNGILGMAEVLALGDLSKQQCEKVEVIKTSGQILLSLLNDVLDFSKIEAGKLELEATRFRPDLLCRQIAQAFTPMASAKTVDLTVTLDPQAAGWFNGDPTRVRQIVTNLVSNAIKFTEAGGVEIVLSAEPQGIALTVKDSGIGIPADKLDRLFAKFEQVDVSTTRRFGGTGLGLSICRDLTTLMGGAIAVESNPGVGSTFKVVLPLPRALDQSLDADQDEAAAADRAVRLAERPLRILAAEDNKTNQLVLTTLLAEVDLSATVVENGALAVSAWEAAEFDLILMDMQMPVMDGMTATAAIRSAERAGGRPRTPIVAFTADVMSHQLEIYRAAGIDSVVSKPVQFQQLIGAIDRALNLSEGPGADSQDAPLPILALEAS
jgi:signal transduction histidine kinase